MYRIAPPIAFLAVVCALSVCALSGCEPEKKEAAAPPPPTDVKVSKVLERDVPVYVEAIGETRGNTEIEIRARVEGFIESVDYKEGQLVKKGDLLYTIDPRPFETNLAQTKAQLAESEARLARAHQDVVRYEPLVAKNAISRQEYDNAVAVEQANTAGVEAAKAVVEQAKIDLSYTKVIAPEDGLAGRTEVYAGTLVGRGQSTLLTRISRIDPIHVRFTFPERDYLELARKRGSGVDAKAGSDVPFELILADGSVLPQPGKLVFVDRNVDAQTGTIMGEAEFPNPGQIIRPGQYARVRATIDTRKGAILVPQRAVQETQGIFNAMVVEGDTVEQRRVEPAERIGSLWVITSGLKSGDRVVVEGLQKVRPKMKVNATEVPIEDKGAAKGEGGSSAPPGSKPAEKPADAPAKEGKKEGEKK
jgi:membrane fusion protein (multidrug efflux system)